MKKLAPIVALGLVLAACGSHPAGTSNSLASPTPNISPSSAPSPNPSPSAPGVLVFEKWSGSTSAQTTFTQLTGTTIKTIASTNADVTFDTSVSNNNNYIGFSSALLSSNELYVSNKVSITKWAVFDKAGNSHPIPDSLTSFLNQSWQGTGWQDGTQALPGTFLPSTNTMYLTTRTRDSIEFDRVDLVTGQITKLVTSQPLSSTGAYWLWPANMSADGAKVQLIAVNASLNGHPVSGIGVATARPDTGAITVNQLPETISNAQLPTYSGSGRPIWAPQLFVSGDGNLVAYETGTVVNATQVLTPHIYNFSTGQDLKLGTAMGWSGGANSVFFSPDGSYAAMVDGSNQEMIVVRTSDGGLVRSFDVPAGSAHEGVVTDSVTPMGWSGDGTLIYVTDTGGPNFNPEGESTHAFNARSGAAYDYPSGLGELIALLY